MLINKLIIAFVMVICANVAFASYLPGMGAGYSCTPTADGGTQIAICAEQGYSDGDEPDSMQVSEFCGSYVPTYDYVIYATGYIIKSAELSWKACVLNSEGHYVWQEVDAMSCDPIVAEYGVASIDMIDSSMMIGGCAEYDILTIPGATSLGNGRLSTCRACQDGVTLSSSEKVGNCTVSRTLCAQGCSAGYYDGPNGCTRCPASADDKTYGTTLEYGSWEIYACHLPSGTLVADGTGTYQFTSNCYYND